MVKLSALGFTTDLSNNYILSVNVSLLNAAKNRIERVNFTIRKFFFSLILPTWSLFILPKYFSIEKLFESGSIMNLYPKTLLLYVFLFSDDFSDYSAEIPI